LLKPEVSLSPHADKAREDESAEPDKSRAKVSAAGGKELDVSNQWALKGGEDDISVGNISESAEPLPGYLEAQVLLGRQK